MSNEEMTGCSPLSMVFVAHGKSADALKVEVEQDYTTLMGELVGRELRM